ncbi:MAG: penicillin acylase family protein [Chitinophagales bacterium]
MSLFYNFISKVGKLGIHQLSKKALPQTSGSFQLKGLHDSINIYRDHWGVPHIYANNLHDLLFAQGFVHAQDRFWQMELSRRTATGTLCEAFGKDALNLDITARTLGFQRLGKKDIPLLTPQALELMEAHIAGINAYLKKYKDQLPIEFTLTQVTPKKWTLEDSMAYSRLMSWQMSHAWHSSWVRQEVVNKIGLEKAADLDIHYSKDNPSIVAKGIEVNNLLDGSAFKASQDPFLKQNGGSNSWAISPQKSTTNHAILSNDPHLGLTAPAIWYENHLHCPGYHVTGVSIAGFPMVVIGHNEHIGWGITLAFTDCEDLFVEKFKSNGSYKYLVGKKWKKAKVKKEKIHIKGEEEPHVEKVIITRHGPIVSNMLEKTEQRVALQSKALEKPARFIQAWWQINTARNWTEFVNGVSFMDAPQFNLTYGDTQGNVGYWLTGKVPIRKGGNGKLPSLGWTGEGDWIGEVPFTEMPHSLNPEKGYVLTANNKVVGDDYPYYLGDSWMNGYRAKRLEDLIEEKSQVSVNDCKQMQVDLYCIPGKAFADLYKELYDSLSIKEQDFPKALYLLAHWDGYLTKDSIGGCLYKITRYFITHNILEQTIGEKLMKNVLGCGVNPPMNSGNEYFGHDALTVLRMLEDTDSWWIEQAGGKEDLLLRSLQQAMKWLEDHIGNNVSTWKWGEVRQLTFAHSLGIRKPLDTIFNLGPFPMGGDGDTPWQVGNVNGEIENASLNSASFRMIIDFGDFSKSQAVMPPGQSGHINSEDYQNQIKMWLEGQLRPMLWDKDQVMAYSEELLKLEKE